MFNYVFPIETINREFDVKLMVAANIVDARSQVYLGQHDYVHQLLGKLRHGVYYGKNCFRGSETESKRVIEQLKSNGFRIFYLHEEGGVFPAEAHGWHAILKRQYDPALLHEDDKVFVWGNSQCKFDLSRRGDVPVPVEALGHPRFDLYKRNYRQYYDRSVEQLRTQYGRYVLLNTNFGLINTVNDWKFSLRRALRERRFVSVGQQFFRFLDLIFTLVEEFPDTRFVIRSHPSENDETYVDLFKKYSNVVVRHEGPVANWIFGADCLVHSGCTTALEAWFAEVPSLDYSGLTDSPLTSEASRGCATSDDVVRNLREILASPYQRPPRPALGSKSRDLLQNIDTDALPVLCEQLRQANDGRGDNPSLGTLQASHAFASLRQNAAQAKSRFAFARAARRTYDAKKFQGFQRESVERSLSTANRILGTHAKLHHVDPRLVVLRG